MPSLPNDPNLEHFRRQARTLQRAARSSDPRALELLARHHPSPAPDPTSLTLSAAQLVIARRYGFASWPSLRHYLDTVAVLGRNPTDDGVTDSGDSIADQFCRRACLVYSEVDGPERWATAAALLAEHPEVVTHSLAAAAAAADPAAIRQHLASDRNAANALTGPHRWPPLLYLTYSRCFRLTRWCT